ncbi:DUF2510 domain-containing protein [Mycobacterium sp.]|uniref:DUF2510 domain-containing protein n=1 Tax=Mycobacterium sp. TaxID=1785 RepID=UPI0034120392
MGKPAGWYEDPSASNAERYWNGETWTPQRRPRNATPTYPPETPGPYGQAIPPHPADTYPPAPNPASTAGPYGSHPAQSWGSAPYPPGAALPPQEKSSGIALLLTIFWPGGGHLYLGLTTRAIPYVVANAIGLALGVLFFPFLVLLTFLIWLITLCMTVGSVTRDTYYVNDALRRGQRIDG